MALHHLTLSQRHYPGDVVVVGVSGELDVATAPKLDDYLIGLASTGHHRLVLNAARLTFCDASGIHVLIRAGRRVERQHGWLRLTAVSPRLRRILTILALLAVLPAFDDVSHAVLAADPQVPDLAVG
jgi:anti-sigma B factor antagonist